MITYMTRVTMNPILKAIREGIRDSDKTRYAISKETGISEGQLHRILNGKAGVSLDNAYKLAVALNLQITVSKRK
jgi:hypothetical protein